MSGRTGSLRILLTGGSGFVGRHALAALAALGAEVHAASRSARPSAKGGVCWHQADLLDQSARRELVERVRPQLIVHAAWETTHGRFWAAPSNLDWASATLELARYAAERGLQRLIGVGTCYEYSRDVAGDCEEHSSPIAPDMPYAVCKDATRRALESFARNSGFSFAWARLFLLYGPSEAPTRLVPAVARSLIAGEPARISSGRAIRDFMDARDAGAALAALALSDAEGAVNIASGQANTVREVAMTIARLAGRSELLEVGALPDRDEPARLVADTRRLRDEVGFHDVRSLEEGLVEALDYWRGKTRSERA